MSETNLSLEERAAFDAHLRTALYHLLAHWDAMREMESIADITVETEDLSDLAGSLGEPGEALTLEQEIVDEVADGLLASEEGDND